MRHRRKTRKLGCKTPHRQAMLRNMVTSLFEHGRIVTTLPRAKEVRRIADHMVTLAKDGSLHSRRQALQVIRSRKVVDKLFDHWAKVFESRSGGYIRIVRIGPRRGDAAMMSVVEAVEESLEKVKKSKKKAKATEPQDVVPQATDKDLASEKETTATKEQINTKEENKTSQDVEETKSEEGDALNTSEESPSEEASSSSDDSSSKTEEKSAEEDSSENKETDPENKKEES